MEANEEETGAVFGVEELQRTNVKDKGNEKEDYVRSI